MGLVAAGLVILGLAGGLIAVISRQKRKAQEVNRLRGFEAFLTEKYKDKTITDSNVLYSLNNILNLLQGVVSPTTA